MKNLLGLGQASVPESSPTLTAPGLSAEEAAFLRDPARTFGRYVLLEELGHGGMGIVYRAWDTLLRRVVALKMAARSHGEATTRTARGLVGGAERLQQLDQDLLERSQREARAASRLDHPNLVRVLDAGLCEEVFYFTMDLVTGTPADEVPLPMPEREAARIVATLARAVGHAHRLQILHRDIKPANVLLSPRAEPMLVDFGLAKDLSAPSMTVTGDVFGTPGYMAPEQAAGDPSLVSTRTDIYGLGATLYHLAAGKPPYAELQPQQILAALHSHPPYPPSTLNPMVSAEMDRIILKAMSREPRDRYATADRLAEDLERVASSGSRAGGKRPAGVVAKRVEPIGAPMPRAVPWWAWALIVAGCMAAGIGVAVVANLGRKEVASRSAAPGSPRTEEAPASHPPASSTTASVEPPAPPANVASRGPAPRPPDTPPEPPKDPARTPEDASSSAPTQDPAVTPPSPEKTSPPPPIEFPPKGGADPAAGGATADVPKAARESHQAAVDAFQAALAITWVDRPEDWRAKMKEALALAEDAAAKAPKWSAPRRLRADLLFSLSRYTDAQAAYGEYMKLAGAGEAPAEGLVAEFLEWFRRSRPWAQEVTPAQAKRGSELACRIEAAAGKPLDASPFLPWKSPAAAAGDVAPEAIQADLETLASLARQDYAKAAEQGKAAAALGGGVAVRMAELMHWVMEDGNARPDALLTRMRDARVRTPEEWLIASWGLMWAGDLVSSGDALMRAWGVREGDPPAEVADAMGLLAYRLGDSDQAKRSCTSAVALEPTNRTYLADLGAVCLLRGEMTEAVQRLTAAILRKTNPDPASERLISFAEYEIACADARTIAETTPHPKAAERTRLADEAVACMRECVRTVAKLPRETETASTQAPRTYAEWSTNNVRHWALVDPWLEGLKEHPTDYRAMKDCLR